MTWILWVKALHIAFMVAWFAGIFYLPRLFVYHAMNAKPAVDEQLCIMERRLLYFVTPLPFLPSFSVWCLFLPTVQPGLLPVAGCTLNWYWCYYFLCITVTVSNY